MDKFIEVEGTASEREVAAKYRAALTLHVRAPELESALKQAAELREQCIRALLEAGLKNEELSEGGAEVWRTWWWHKKNVGQEANHRVLITCAESGRLYAGLSALEPLVQNKRHTLDIRMLSPVFEFPEADRVRCQVAAIADAQTKAAIIAQAARVQLGGILQVEELSERSTHSGARGDEDWGYAVAAAGGGAALSEPVELEAPSRSRSLRYRVRFSISTE